jgi:Transglycosylase-like domain
MFRVSRKPEKKSSGAFIAIAIGVAAAFLWNAGSPGSSSYQQCVINKESSGNPQVWNGSHWGLYQFQKSTWEEYGGSASSFGNASAAEQTQVFNNAISQGGQYNWSPYDGC